MPPNLGGFFMVRSYYPSECHADYFDFERIEALKPAIEACGISTLSQSPMLGFHKQMDNSIKLLEEILSFRMQGVEFDNGDMYVDGHKRSEERFSRNAETDLVCRLLLEKKKPERAAEPDEKCERVKQHERGGRANVLPSVKLSRATN